MKLLIALLFLFNFVYAQINVVVSILPQQTFVEKIGGDKVNVNTMVRPGSEPHSYEPKPSQMKNISKADIYFPIGLEFEHTWLEKFAAQNDKMKFIKMAKNVKLIEMAKHNHEHSEHEEEEHEDHEKHDDHDEKDGLDPHTWTSPSNVKIMAKNIFTALSKMDSSNQKYYEKNYLNFIEEINETDKKIKKILSSLEKGSKFMVFHPSWGYFAKEYNLEQLVIEVEGKEVKPKMLQKIIEEAREEKVKAIFTQSEFSDKSARVIASELKIKVLKETPLAKNWSQNLIKMANSIASNK